MNRIKSILILAFSGLLFSCRESPVGPAEWAGKQLDLSGDYLTISARQDINLALHDTSSIKIVNYFNPKECSPCRLRDLIDWHTLFEEFAKDSIGARFRFINIFGMNRDANRMKPLLMTYRIDYPVYLDTAGLFERSNPGLPTNPVFHTFLLDKENRVVLVGSPIGNAKMWDLYKSTISRLVASGGTLPDM